MPFSRCFNPRTRTRFAERRKTGIRISSGVLIVEGVIALAIEPLVQAADLRLFVAISDVDRLRRLKYFYTNKKGLTLKETEEIIQSREMEEVPFIKKTANVSVIFVRNRAGAEKGPTRGVGRPLGGSLAGVPCRRLDYQQNPRLP
mgnify:CR=1 FL=1